MKSCRFRLSFSQFYLFFCQPLQSDEEMTQPQTVETFLKPHFIEPAHYSFSHTYLRHIWAIKSQKVGLKKWFDGQKSSVKEGFLDIVPEARSWLWKIPGDVPA